MSIGQSLAEARERAGLSIEDVAARTRLRASVIRAMENDDFSLCGGHFYARAHLRTLAGVVGIDPAPLLAEYDARYGRNEDDDVTAKLAEVETASKLIARTQELRRTSWGSLALAALLVVIIVAVGAQLLTSHGRTPSRASGPVGAPSSASGPSPSAAATPSISAVPSSGSPSPPPTGAPSSAVAEAGVKVVVRVTTAKCWVLARASDGTTLYQGIMNPGDVQTFTDPQQIYLKLGNAPATDLVVNGVEIGAPPSTNDVAAFTFGPGPPNVGQG
ncbi:conserved hypothetical protein [Acidothermus cellulolyticus 11B]|uniref:HTH cro/C1-type domain-containing protein n=1 Tax=Acidothermus cellulolyticus (strain ATCC 43068 / DSM 8971 / 11B) TaxID=351607 RepID=A0LV12_ACIC1|nr:helix-turn-helix domain-containing protein [Acidothermus cellulolyticus]ABK53272.1 conserved hypothetical protein [Acidothermus cellulolyticus 11B]